MTYTYKKIKNPMGDIYSNLILRKEDNAFIPFDEANMDYQQYKLWLAEGNTPDPAD